MRLPIGRGQNYDYFERQYFLTSFTKRLNSIELIDPIEILYVYTEGIDNCFDGLSFGAVLLLEFHRVRRRHEHVDIPLLIHLVGIQKSASLDTESISGHGCVLDFEALVCRAKVVGAFVQDLTTGHLVFIDLDTLASNESSLWIENGGPKERLWNRRQLLSFWKFRL